MSIWSIVGLAFCGLYFVTWIAGIVWLAHPFKLGTWFFHNILGWHRPNDEQSFDGLSCHSRCRFCNKEIMEDGQGNWFTF